MDRYLVSVYLTTVDSRMAEPTPESQARTAEAVLG